MNYMINDIESLTQNEAKEMALETMDIKGHTIYFVDFEGYFKYSALVFLNGGYLYYANEYQLHYPEEMYPTRESLRERFIEKLNNTLFTEKELSEVEDYNDYEAKSYYLRNYYNMQKPYVSAFYISTSPEKDEEFKKSVEGMIYNPNSFCYMNKEDEPFIKHQTQLLVNLQKARREKENSYEYMKKAFLYEMYNHEYGINWEADYDVLSCFGRLEYKGNDMTCGSELKDYFEQLKFDDTKKQAYMDARKQYYNENKEAM